jgi:predicted Zn-dependent peptidase
LIQKEFSKLQEKELTASSLKKIKSQLKGQLAMAEEGNLNFMLMMAKNLLDREKIESLEDIFEQIDVIDSAHIQSLANEMLNPDSLSYLIFEP